MLLPSFDPSGSDAVRVMPTTDVSELEKYISFILTSQLSPYGRRLLSAGLGRNGSLPHLLSPNFVPFNSRPLVSGMEVK